MNSVNFVVNTKVSLIINHASTDKFAHAALILYFMDSKGFIINTASIVSRFCHVLSELL